MSHRAPTSDIPGSLQKAVMTSSPKKEQVSFWVRCKVHTWWFGMLQESAEKKWKSVFFKNDYFRKMTTNLDFQVAKLKN